MALNTYTKMYRKYLESQVMIAMSELSKTKWEFKNEFVAFLVRNLMVSIYLYTFLHKTKLSMVIGKTTKAHHIRHFF